MVTWKQIYLRKTPISSNHPNTEKEYIPYGLGLRVKRICSDQNDYQKRKRDLKGNVKKRGYSSNLIDKQFQRVDELEREDFLKYNQPKQSDRVSLVLTYTDALPNIHTILRKHLDTLYNSEEMKQVFSQPPIFAFRRDKNFRHISSKNIYIYIYFTINPTNVNPVVKTVHSVSI